MKKDIYPFKKFDGFVRPCKKGCPNCTHCTDVFWDYSNGIYGAACEIHVEHGVCCEDYKNDGTEPVTIAEFSKMKEEEDKMINNILRKGN